MKQKISYLFTLVVLSLSLIMPVTALAAESTSSTSGSTDSSTTSDDTTTEVETNHKTADERIALFKTRFKVKLGVAEAAHIKLKCVGAQGVVGNLHSHFGEKGKPRVAAYTNLQKRLDSLVTKLKAKSVDTTTLESQIATLKTKIATYNTDLTAYLQSISDLKDVSCTQDPDAFQAALLAARSAHETLVADILAIRTYMKDTLRPTLVTIKKSVEDKASTTSSEGSN